MRKLVLFHQVLALAIIATGLFDVAVGTTMLAPSLDRALAETRMLDSNFRFLGGFWLAAGAGMLWALRDLPARVSALRVLWVMLFAGGLGRIASAAALGLPPASFIGFGVFELAAAPLALWWLEGRRSALAATPS